MAGSEDTGERPEAAEHTKLVYVDGEPTLTVRRLEFIVTRADGRVATHVSDKDVVTLGSMEENDVVIADETVSRAHCKIWRERSEYLIADLDSTNGTYVDRVKIRQAYLSPESVVGLGNSEIRIRSVDERMKVTPSDKQRFGEMIGRNDKMREIYAIFEKIAPTDATVIVEGETGTGKEVVARTIHQASRRREGPFVVFDCGAVPENLIESELFGHEKGSFTGAITSRQGVFEMASGGTVFLDELGELAIELQPKLLRVLEQREVKRVGGSKPIKVDVRVVAATNRQLEKEVREGRFREDLFYRLSVVRVRLPALRERKEDIPLLVRHFLKQANFNKTADGQRKVQHVSAAAMDKLMEHAWPGNVRELHNVVERAVSFSDGDTIQVADLPEHVGALRRESGTSSEPARRASAAHELPARDPVGAMDGPLGTFKDAKEKWIAGFERDYIAQLLQKNGANISHAAREAELDRKYFRKLMKKYGLHGKAAPGEDDEDD